VNRTIRLRDASPSDSELVFAIFQDAMRSYVEEMRAWDGVNELEQHRARFARQRCRIVVVGDGDPGDPGDRGDPGDTVAGYISTAVYPEASERYPAGLYLHHLMIKPAFQSQGVGAMCLKWLADEARQLRVPLNLRVLRVNPRALAFYLAEGGKVVGESESHIFVRMAGEA
jgi:GNAT superfamily N-acetyltransferase